MLMMPQVYIVIPMYPEGDPSSVPSQEILHWQFRTMEAMYARIARWGHVEEPPKEKD